MSAPGRSAPSRARDDRLARLVGSGLIDSFGLALGWTVFNLHGLALHGLPAVGWCNAAMLIGVALSAPVAGRVAARADGRGLLRGTAVAEAVLRVATFAAMVAGAPLPLIAAGVVVLYVVSWTGYAGMRAEVAAVDSRAAAMTWYAVSILSIEAVGTAAAAVLPAGADGTLPPALLWGAAVVYAGSLVPQYLVGRDARVSRAPRTARQGTARARRALLAGGAGVMLLGSGPTLLVVGLAAELHGRASVAAAGAAFTAGALVAPAVAAHVERRAVRPAVSWPLLGAGMVLGWIVAPWHVAGLVVAQFLSGGAMSAFEGIMDTRMSAGGGATADLAWSAAARAGGSAAAVGAAPALIASTGVVTLSGSAGILLLGALLLAVAPAPLRPRLRCRPAGRSRSRARTAGGTAA